jgi:hypothetical protein
MTDGAVDTSPRLHARMAGVSYLLGSLTPVVGQMVVLGMIFVSGSAEATAANILSHESLFRLGFVASLMTVPFHLAWAVLFHGLFRPVNRSVSLLAGFVMLLAWPNRSSQVNLLTREPQARTLAQCGVTFGGYVPKLLLPFLERALLPDSGKRLALRSSCNTYR